MSNMHQPGAQPDASIARPLLKKSLLGLPDELVNQILLRLTLPSFIQFIQSSKRIRDLARTNHTVLTHFLQEVPGDKSSIESDAIEKLDKPSANAKLFLLLQQRASKQLVGLNFTADCHEHTTRNAEIDPFASAIEGFDTDYVSVSLAFRNQADIRQYSQHLRLRERIDTCFGSGWTIFKIVQWKSYASALISQPESDKDDPDLDGESQCSSPKYDHIDAQALAEGSLFTSRATCRANLSSHNSITKRDEVLQVPPGRRKYELVHFQISSTAAPEVHKVSPPLWFYTSHYVPKDLAIFDETKWAILWDVEDAQLGPRPRLLSYTSNAYDGKSPDLRILWPRPLKGKKAVDNDADAAALKKCKPRRIAFFRDGESIKLYGAGDIVPKELVSVHTHVREQYNPTNVIEYNTGPKFYVDTAFYGTHATKEDGVNGYKFCHMKHLCLGLAELAVEDDRHVHILCLLRSYNKTYVDSCDHTVSLQKIPHLSSTNTEVVARLWGWEKWWTNLTGLETVAISTHGTRIAIAMWNKVLVYALNPRVLCEDVDYGEYHSKKKRRMAQEPPGMPTKFYHRVRYDELDRDIVELKPIVLDLNGDVVHKMRWIAPNGMPSDDFGLQETDGDKTDASDESAATKEADEDATESSQSVAAVASAVVEPNEAQANVEPVNSEQSPGTDGDIEASEPVTTASTTKAGQAATPGTEANKDTCMATGAQVEATTDKAESYMVPAPNAALHSASPQVESQSAAVVNSPPLGPSGPKTTARKKDKQSEMSIAEVGGAVAHIAQPSHHEVSPFTAPKPEALESVIAIAPGLPGNPINNRSALSGSGLSASIELAKMDEATVKEGVVKSKSALTQLDESEGESEASENEVICRGKARASGAQDALRQALPRQRKTTKGGKAKRITEDELLILTDRGVQVWNLGAGARRRRKRTSLELEGRMKGKMPMRE